MTKSSFKLSKLQLREKSEIDKMEIGMNSLSLVTTLSCNYEI